MVQRSTFFAFDINSNSPICIWTTLPHTNSYFRHLVSNQHNWNMLSRPSGSTGHHPLGDHAQNQRHRHPPGCQNVPGSPLQRQRQIVDHRRTILANQQFGCLHCSQEWCRRSRNGAGKGTRRLRCGHGRVEFWEFTAGFDVCGASHQKVRFTLVFCKFYRCFVLCRSSEANSDVTLNLSGNVEHQPLVLSQKGLKLLENILTTPKPKQRYIFNKKCVLPKLPAL